MSDAQTMMTYDANKKSGAVAYLLWFFLGGLGAHRFYLGRNGTAVTQLIITIIGILTAVLVVGFFLIGIVAIWLLVDAFLIPGIIREKNNALAGSLSIKAAVPSAPKVLSAKEADEEIKALEGMKQSGTLSEEEFEEKRAKVIARMG